MDILILNEKTRKKRRKWSWTDLNIARAKDIIQIAEHLYNYWPVTERHLYYRLISSDKIRAPHWCQHNNSSNPSVNIYGAIGPLLKWMRIDRKLRWDVIADETRIITAKMGFESAKSFVRKETERFLRGYSRCVAQDQPNHIEIWIEKQTLLRIVEPVADEFCRRVLCCRGYNSVTFQADFYQRRIQAIDQGLKPIVLYFGDWDPSGVNMIYAAMQTLHDEFGLDEGSIEFHRCGINPEHFHLIHENPEPLQVKKTDSLARDFVKRYGNVCYELDAFHPEQLQDLVRESIREFTDMEVVACNADIEGAETDFLYGLKKDVEKFVHEKLRQDLTFSG